MKKITTCFSIVVISLLLVSFAEKRKPYEIVQDKNILGYTMNYDNEDYAYEVKVAKSKRDISFNYRIVGGTKILSGVYNAYANGDYYYKNDSLTIPGSLVEGTDLNMQLIQELSLEGSFMMRMERIKFVDK